MPMDSSQRIAVIGLGYVGLPLAVALARHFEVTGLDIDGERVAELRGGHDRTGEVAGEELSRSALRITSAETDITGSDVFVITVPTPVDADKKPDLSAVQAACDTVGRQLRPGALVVLESTVYPGATEEICAPRLQRASRLKCGSDFHLGYSPERINPGDRSHTVDRITKVVAGQTPDVTERLRALYAKITEGGVFVARDIRTAEAAKVIENSQRDINIAFVNEIAVICQRLGLSVYDVLDAARTKWNFLPFSPGLVGGHCIGVDPYYLAYRAEQVGYDPEVILAGRRVNDRMGSFVSQFIHDLLATQSRILALGLTFKEDVPDLRNSKAIDVIEGLIERGHQIDVHDPIADPAEAKQLYGVELIEELPAEGDYDAVVALVRHGSYDGWSSQDLVRLLRDGGLVADVKGMWRGLELPASIRRWQL